MEEQSRRAGFDWARSATTDTPAGFGVKQRWQRGWPPYIASLTTSVPRQCPLGKSRAC